MIKNKVKGKLDIDKIIVLNRSNFLLDVEHLITIKSKFKHLLIIN